MHKVTGCLDGVNYRRVSKSVARRMWNAGSPILFCAVNLWPFGGWRPGCTVDKASAEQSTCYDVTFDGICHDFEWHNANSYETGYYAAFYVPVIVS